ncbi:BCCT family transporter [Corynebacterium guangdongense]|uniref:Choline/carnitine/betaine transport n=1 Tax=Corynebacterium guangdongense TaxID=1783348 RepID=A0ABU1ZV96_9CORY|nr:BCCT family transporter [Corynebacterium guangdongense]MDR7328853.1 choline/carnitine/betaine transport [Corynebacterium guangdongense]WJZ17428.1 Glycine betaine transporter BetP [Corynebacterium guangdongense]
MSENVKDEALHHAEADGVQRDNPDYHSVADELAGASATEQLAALLNDDDRLTVADYPEDHVTLQSEDENARIDWVVVVPAMLLVISIVSWGLLGGESFATFANGAFTWVLDNVGWAFTLFGTIFVVFVLVVALSRFGSIRLGGSDEEPEFRTISWIAMMFAAGMGIGLMFYGASEPLAHYLSPVPGREANEVGTAMATAMYHWTLHPWALYAIVGLAIGYSTFRLGRKQLLSSAFIPLIGRKAAEGWVGKLIDILSIFATVFGTACSLGLGTLQIRSGLQASGFMDDPGQGVIIGIVLVLTLAFILSAISGVGKGIQYLSNFNIILAAILAIFVFVFGPTVTQLNILPTSIGAYFSKFFEMASWTGVSADGTAGEWLGGWTIFYWAWWVSWSPFVGMFLARISRGRTIREFCLGVLIVPSVLSTVWFSVFGGTAIWMENNDQSIVGGGTTEEQLFNLLHSLPGGMIAGVVAVILLGTFFITSADSASTVMGSMSQNGKSDANRWVTAAWGIMAALVGLTLLVVGGDDALNALQSVTIVAATPFLFIIFLLMFAIVKDLMNDVIYLDAREQQRFARQLAIERRLHREKAYRDAQKERRRSVLARKAPKV